MRHCFPSPQLLKLLCTLVCISMLGGCASQRALESDLGLSDAPDWVNMGTQAVDNENGRLLQGVGMADAMNNTSLQRSTADNRARAEIARILSLYVDNTLKDYSSNSAESSRESVEQSLTSSTRTALTGARIIARWLDPETGTLYAFAELDMQQVEALLSTSSALSSELKTYLSSQANDSFQLLIKETQP